MQPCSNRSTTDSPYAQQLKKVCKFYAVAQPRRYPHPAKKGIDLILTCNSNKNAAEKVVKEIQALRQKAATLKLGVADIVNFGAFISGLKTSLKSEFSGQEIDFLINNGGFGASNSSIGKITIY